jgi:uncharacterized membrane protein YkvA (DUF1232 family)
VSAFEKAQAYSSQMAGDAAGVARGFWRKIRPIAGQIPFAEDAIASYYCAMDKKTPSHVRGALIAALTYFIVPTDLIPDFLPALGFGDDAAVIAATIQLISSHIKPEHREAAKRAFAELDGKP